METTIKVNEDYRVINFDEYNWTVEKRHIITKGFRDNTENVGKETWINKGYFGNIEQVFKFVADNMIKDTVGDITKIEEIYKQIVKFGNEVLTQLKK